MLCSRRVNKKPEFKRLHLQPNSWVSEQHADVDQRRFASTRSLTENEPSKLHCQGEVLINDPGSDAESDSSYVFQKDKSVRFSYTSDEISVGLQGGSPDFSP